MEQLPSEALTVKVLLETSAWLYFLLYISPAGIKRWQAQQQKRWEAAKPLPFHHVSPKYS